MNGSGVKRLMRFQDVENQPDIGIRIAINGGFAITVKKNGQNAMTVYVAKTSEELFTVIASVLEGIKK